MLTFVVAGLTTGSIFALAAIGLVLTFKTSGVFNFGHGAIASATAFVFYAMADRHGVPSFAAAAVCVLVFGPVIGLLLELIARHLATATLAMKVLAMVGVLLAIQGGLELLFPPGPDREVRQFLPSATVHIAGAPVTAYQLIIFAVGLAAVIFLTVFLRTARAGLAMRAVVESPELLDIMGTSPTRTRRLAWVVGSTLAATSGLLLAPLLPLDATSMTFLIVTAFGAAAIGRFTSLPWAYIGGLAIGVGQALLQKYFVSSTGLAGGLASSLPFLILFVLLVVLPRSSLFNAAERLERPTYRPWNAPLAISGGGLLLVLAGLVTVPWFAGLHLEDWTRMCAYLILFLSLGILVRLSGQVSLAHVGFMAIGVVAFVHVADGDHWPWAVSLVFAALVAAPVGALLAIPAIRFPGLYLALASLGFGLLLQQMFYTQSYMFGAGSGLLVPRPHLSWLAIDSDRGYYYVTLAVAVLTAIGCLYLARSRPGRMLSAMSDSSTALEACGASTNLTRVLVFSLSASLAAIAGVMDAGVFGLVGGDQYQPLLSIQLFAVILLVAGNTPWFAIFAAAAQVVVPSYISTSPTVGYALTTLFGVSAIAVSITPSERRVVPVPVRRLLERIAWQPRRRTAAAQDMAEGPSDSDVLSVGALSVDGLVVRYGGLIAVNGISIDAPPGKVTGLIGPNGAGKSTVFNACSGLVRPAQGIVRLGEFNLRRLSPAARARRGLGRTFQQMELFDSLSVRDNVSIGCEAAFAGWNPFDHMFASRRQRRYAEKRTEQALDLCGLRDLAETQVGVLSTGQRRLVELARCVAGRYGMLLLDEPSSGLDRIETKRFGEILRRIVRERGLGILLIEHDMTLVNELCDYVYVIDFGQPVFSGTVAEVGASPAVRSAYLGEEGFADLPSLGPDGRSA